MRHHRLLREDPPHSEEEIRIEMEEDIGRQIERTKEVVRRGNITLDIYVFVECMC